MGVIHIPYYTVNARLLLQKFHFWHLWGRISGVFWYWSGARWTRLRRRAIEGRRAKTSVDWQKATYHRV